MRPVDDLHLRQHYLKVCKGKARLARRDLPADASGNRDVEAEACQSQGAVLECPVSFVPVEMRQTGTTLTLTLVQKIGHSKF